MSAGDVESLPGFVEVDNTVIGGFELSSVERSNGKRKNVEAAIEFGLDGKGIVRTRMIQAKA